MRTSPASPVQMLSGQLYTIRYEVEVLALRAPVADNVRCARVR